jgi:hypothetical protein
MPQAQENAPNRVARLRVSPSRQQHVESARLSIKNFDAIKFSTQDDACW